MRIRELLNSKSVQLNGEASSKQDVITKMTKLMEASGNLTDRAAYEAGVWEREKEGTTGIGEGIAIPHSKNAAVKSAGLAAMTLPKGVDYEAMDGEPVNLIFMIAAPENGANEHLEALSKLSTMLMDDDFRAQLTASKSVEEFLAAIDAKENAIDAKNSEVKEVPAGTYRVLGITACPTGIAHTYMAAEALENKGAEIGIPVKVETQEPRVSAMPLQKKKSQQQTVLLLQRTKGVDLSRFERKAYRDHKVADASISPEELIREQSAAMHRCIIMQQYSSS